MTRERGFTLIEMLAALMIFGLIAAAMALSLSGALKSREAVAALSDRGADLEVARAVMRADFAQIAPRPSRNAFGATRPFRFEGRESAVADAPLLAFTRAGWSNPGAEEARGGLVYVEYRLQDGDLVRRVRPRPDAAADSAVFERVLFQGAGAVTLRYFDGVAWQPEWLLPARASGKTPRAVAISMDADGIGRIEQLFLTGGEE